MDGEQQQAERDEGRRESAGGAVGTRRHGVHGAYAGGAEDGPDGGEQRPAIGADRGEREAVRADTGAVGAEQMGGGAGDGLHDDVADGDAAEEADGGEDEAFDGDEGADLEAGEGHGAQHRELADALGHAHVEGAEDEEQGGEEGNACGGVGLGADVFGGGALVQVFLDVVGFLELDGRGGAAEARRPAVAEGIDVGVGIDADADEMDAGRFAEEFLGEGHGDVEATEGGGHDLGDGDAGAEAGDDRIGDESDDAESAGAVAFAYDHIVTDADAELPGDLGTEGGFGKVGAGGIDPASVIEGIGGLGGGGAEQADIGHAPGHGGGGSGRAGFASGGGAGLRTVPAGGGDGRGFFCGPHLDAADPDGIGGEDGGIGGQLPDHLRGHEFLGGGGDGTGGVLAEGADGGDGEGVAALGLVGVGLEGVEEGVVAADGPDDHRRGGDGGQGGDEEADGVFAEEGEGEEQDAAHERDSADWTACW